MLMKERSPSKLFYPKYQRNIGLKWVNAETYLGPCQTNKMNWNTSSSTQVSSFDCVLLEIYCIRNPGDHERVWTANFSHIMHIVNFIMCKRFAVQLKFIISSVSSERHHQNLWWSFIGQICLAHYSKFCESLISSLSCSMHFGGPKFFEIKSKES